MQRAARMQAVQESPIIRVAQKARELKSQGHPVLSLSIGVPGFTPPANVYEAAAAALKQDGGDYLPGRGQPALIKAFQSFLKARGFDYAEAELIAQVGGKGALFNIFLAVLNPGDKVAIPAPYWASYPEMVKIVGAEPVIITAPAAQNYKITATQLQDALKDPAIKLFLFNNPSNPTGMLYTADEVAALAAVLKNHPQVMIISDDIYDALVFEENQTQNPKTPKPQHLVLAPHLLHHTPELKDRTILVQSVSKTYGMPGWRVGFVAAPKGLVDDLLTLTSQSFTNIPGVVQAAAQAALELDGSHLATQKSRLAAQRDETLAALSAMGLPCPVPQGAFYAFPQVTPAFGKTTPTGAKITDDVTFCNALLEEAHVAVVPGSAFGDAGAIRISYAGNPQDLTEALTRLQTWLTTLA